MTLAGLDIINLVSGHFKLTSWLVAPGATALECKGESPETMSW